MEQNSLIKEEFKDQVIICTVNDCTGNLFLLRWIFKHAPEKSGLYRCCAKCGNVSAIIEGQQMTLESI